MHYYRERWYSSQVRSIHCRARLYASRAGPTHDRPTTCTINTNNSNNINNSSNRNSSSRHRQWASPRRMSTGSCCYLRSWNSTTEISNNSNNIINNSSNNSWCGRRVWWWPCHVSITFIATHRFTSSCRWNPQSPWPSAEQVLSSFSFVRQFCAWLGAIELRQLPPLPALFTDRSPNSPQSPQKKLD